MSSRRPVHMPVFTPNPLDKATIVSIIPKDIEEVKYTLHPSKYSLKAGTPTLPSVTVVGAAVWYKEDPNTNSFLAIPVSAITLAESIVNDYCNGLIGCNMADVMPGLFSVPGDKKLEEIPKELIKKAEAQQKRWYENLVKMADISWSRTNGNPLIISEDMKLAAKSLHYEDKPWLRDFQMSKMVSCPACGALRNDNFPVCGNCHTIVDKTKYDLLKLSKAS